MPVYDMKQAKHSKGNVRSAAAITTDVLFNCSCLISPCVAGGLLALACDVLVYCVLYTHITINFIKKESFDDEKIGC